MGHYGPRDRLLLFNMQGCLWRRNGHSHEGCLDDTSLVLFSWLLSPSPLLTEGGEGAVRSGRRAITLASYKGDNCNES